MKIRMKKCVNNETHLPARDIFHSFARSLNIDYEKLKESIDEK